MNNMGFGSRCNRGLASNSEISNELSESPDLP